MKKNLLLTATIFFYHQAICQADYPKLINDTLCTACGFKIAVGQELKLGTGTRDNGDFKYISISRNSWMAPGPKQASMRKTSNHHTAAVKKLTKHGSEKNGYTYYIVIGTGDIVNYECEVGNAITAGEILVPDDCKRKLSSKTLQPVSVADEIAKLKKLYDDGVITKEEFEAQKKKLLEAN